MPLFYYARQSSLALSLIHISLRRYRMTILMEFLILDIMVHVIWMLI